MFRCAGSSALRLHTRSGFLLSSESPPGINEKRLAEFENLALARRSVKRFADKPVPAGLIRRLLRTAQRAPSGYNLQPWAAVVVTSPERRAQLLPAALSQSQVKEAPIVVVFAGNTRAIDHLPRAWRLGFDSGYYAPSAEALYHRNIRFMLEPGPCGALQVFKYALTEGYGRVQPALSVPLSLQGYAWKHTMMPVMNFLNAASAAGLSCSPMEGIDENAVKKVVKFPDHYTVPCIVAVGYPHPSEADRVQSPRFPLEEVCFGEEFGQPLE